LDTLSIESFMILAVLVPVILSTGLLILPQKGRYTLVSVLILLLAALAVNIYRAETLGTVSVFSREEAIIALSFTGHEYSQFMVLGFTVMGVSALLYGLQKAGPGEQMLSFWALAGAIGVVLSHDFITMFLFWELLTITTAGLIFLNNTRQSYIMGYRFLLFHLIGGLLFFVGIIQHYAATASTALEVPEAGLVFFVLGFAFKAAFLPFHIWVAWGYPSASPFSSVLLAGLTTKIGVYAFARVLGPYEGLEYALAFMGASMAIVGICCALMQKNMRRLLSYHIVSQVGYMIAGVGLGASLAVDGGLLHLANNLLYKSLLFMTAGVVLVATGSENLHDLSHQEEEEEGEGKTARPVWKVLPLTTAGAVIGALAIAGFPLFNGYVSKHLLKYAVEGMGPVEWMLLLASVGTTMSFCKFVYFGFLKARAGEFNQPSPTMQAAIAIVSALCILLGIRPELIGGVLPYGSNVEFLEIYTLSGVGTALLLVGAGVVVFALLAGPLHRGLPVSAWVSVEYLIFMPAGKIGGRVINYLGEMLENIGQNIKNINVDQLLIGTVLIFVLIIIFYFGIFGGA